MYIYFLKNCFRLHTHVYIQNMKLKETKYNFHSPPPPPRDFQNDESKFLSLLVANLRSIHSSWHTYCLEKITVTKNSLEITQLCVLRSLLISETWTLDSSSWKKKICHSNVTQTNHKSFKQPKYFPPLSVRLWYLCNLSVKSLELV